MALSGRSKKAVSSFFLSGYSQHSLASIATRERWESEGQEAGTGTPPLEAQTPGSALISEQSPLSNPELRHQHTELRGGISVRVRQH